MPTKALSWKLVKRNLYEKKELTPEEKKRLLEIEELKGDFKKKAAKTKELSERFCKRAAAYASVKSLTEDEPIDKEDKE